MNVPRGVQFSLIPDEVRALIECEAFDEIDRFLVRYRQRLGFDGSWRVLELTEGPFCQGVSGQCYDIRVSEIGCKTAYDWNGKGEDPNRNPVLCESCADEYNEHWDDMWNEYYSGRL